MYLFKFYLAFLKNLYHKLHLPLFMGVVQKSYPENLGKFFSKHVVVQLVFTSSKFTINTLEKDRKYVQG